MAAIKYLAHIDLNKNSLLNAVIQPLGTPPSNPKLGQIYYDSGAKLMKQWDGSTWKSVGDIYVHPNHTGHVHSTGDGATVIQSNVVTNAMLSDMAASRIKGTVSAGDPQDLTPAQVLSIIGVTAGAEPNIDPTVAVGVTETVATITMQPGADTANIPAATTAKAGVMSKADKVKLNSLVSHVGTSLGNNTAVDKITVTSSTGNNTEILGANTGRAGVMTVTQVNSLGSALQHANLSISAISAISLTIGNTAGNGVVLPLATTSLSGLMAPAEKSKLIGLVTHEPTNLTQSKDGSTITIISSTGTNTTLIEGDASNAGVMTSTQWSKLESIETAANVTDTDNVTAAGAVMKSMASTSGFNFVLDEDNMASNSATKLATQQSIKAYVDNAVTAGNTNKGGYDPVANAPNLTSPGASVQVSDGDTYTITKAGSVHGHAVTPGDSMIADATTPAGTPLTEAQWTFVIKTNDLATQTAPGLVEIATQAEVDEGTIHASYVVTPLTLRTKLGIIDNVTQSVSRKVVKPVTANAVQIITHDLASQFVNVDVYEANAPFAKVECEIRCKTVNTVELLFNVAPTSGKYTVVING